MQKKSTLGAGQYSAPSTGVSAPEPQVSEPPALTASDYEVAHGENLARTLDLDTWKPGTDLVEMYERLAGEIQEAVKQETLMQHQIRREIFPRLKTRPGAPSQAGVYRVSPEDIQRTHSSVL